MPHPADIVTLASGFRVDRTAAAAHVMEPAHTRGVRSFRGRPDLAPIVVPPLPARIELSFNTDGFVKDLNAALADHTAGYVMQLRHRGQPIAAAQVNWAKRPADGSESWGQNVRMHIASCSKLITAMAMTRALQAKNLPSSTHIIDYLPTYWAKGPNIDKITFDQLMTHTSGFRVSGSDTFFPIMKAQIAAGVAASDLGQYSYQNMNFSLCRILLSVMTGAIAAGTTFPDIPPGIPGLNDQLWDYVTIGAYANYVATQLFQPAGVSGPTLTHPDADALAYTVPPGSAWNSGDLTADCGGTSWHMSVTDLLNVMGCFRRQGTIVTPAVAQAMLDASHGIDQTTSTRLGSLYNKSGWWQGPDGQVEQSVTFFLPRDMELAVLANSPLGPANVNFTGDITKAYLKNIVAEFPVGYWVARHNLASDRYQMAFNDYVGNHGMQLMSLSGYGGTTPLFAALWIKNATPPAWQARHGLTAADYQATFNQLTAAGFHPTLVNGYATPNGPRFACIFTNGPTGAWVARHGLTAAQYQAAFNDLVGQGYMLDWVSGYFDGQQDLYAAIWRKQANTPAWEARHGLTADDYQAYFNDVVGRGFKPAVVCGYSDGSRDRYAAIFRKTANTPAWQARHGLTPDQYQTTFDQLIAQGYRLELVNGYTVNGRDRLAGIWTK